MPGTFTFTVEPTAQTVVAGLLRHAYVLTYLAFLSGLLFGSAMLQPDEQEPP